MAMFILSLWMRWTGYVEHHVVHFYMKDGVLEYRISNLLEDSYSRERKDPILKQKVLETVQGELMAHLNYLMFADRAERRGMGKIANLFRAFAASEYYHARNFYAVLARPAAFAESVETYIPGETFEYESLYRMMEEYADRHKLPLAKQAYGGAAAAEREHAALLKKAADLEEFSVETVYVCPICGYIMSETSDLERCPVCGGPKGQFEAYQEKVS